MKAEFSSAASGAALAIAGNRHARLTPRPLSALGSLTLMAAVATICVPADAQIVRVSEGDFKAGAGLITFSETTVSPTNPVYNPSDYGGDANSPTVSFGGLFVGQSLSANPDADCPGAAATACVVGKPTGSLSLDPTSPKVFFANDGANPTSPVLSGTPTFNGPIAIVFSKDQAGVGFDGGYFDAVGSTGITAFARDGALLGTVVNTGTGIEFLGLVTANGEPDIAGVFLDLVGAEPAGFAIDNVRFGLADEITIPGMPGGGFSFWDGDAAGNANNGVVDGGNGVWSATSGNFTTANGATNGVYSPNPTTAVFEGKAGTVTVDDSKGAIAVNGINFDVSRYVITGDPITLAGNTATISVGDGTPTGTNIFATIDSVLTGSAGLTKTDYGRLFLNGVNTYTGSTVVAQGVLTGSATSFGAGPVTIDTGASLELRQPTDATFANTIDGGGILSKTGTGTLTLTGDSPGYTGNAVVVAGGLVVNADFGNARFGVGNGNTLGGTGTLHSLTALSGSTISPGDGSGAIGTLTVETALNQETGAIYAVKLSSTGTSDHLNVGTARLDPGAELVVTKIDSPRYVLGAHYTVLTAADGFTGKYVLSGDTHVSLFYDLVDSYDAHNVYLDVLQTHAFASVAGTPNEIAAAGGADSVGSGTLHDAIGYLQTVPEALAAFDAISGEIHATVRAAAFEDSRFVREAVFGHLDSATDRDLWMHVFGSWGHMNGDGNAARYSRQIGGGILGADVIKSGSFRAGPMIGYGRSTLDLPARASSATANDVYVGAYAGMGSGPVQLDLGGSYTFRKLDTSRSITFTGFSDSATARYELGIGQFFGELSAKVPVGALMLQPFARAAWVHLDSGHEYESGGPAALEILQKSDETYFTDLGGRIGFDIGGVKVSGSGAWRHAGSNSVSVPLAFSGGDVFSIAAPPIAKNVAAVDFIAEAQVAPRAIVSVGYSGQMGDGLQDHGLKASLSYAF